MGAIDRIKEEIRDRGRTAIDFCQKYGITAHHWRNWTQRGLPDSQIIKGIIVGIGAWLLMMVGAFPMSGCGLFGLGIGPMAPVMTFVLHVIFGVALGASYGKLTS